jgi:hypothetical protein
MALYKKFILFFLFTGVILTTAEFVFAERTLEVTLPSIGDNVVITEIPTLPDYVKYIFNFIIGLAGFIVFISITYGGIRYLISAGNPAAMSDANEQIFSGIIGLVVILGSWIILTTINPQLIKINPQIGDTELPSEFDLPGVYLCKTNTGEENSCDGPFTSDQSSLSSGFNDATDYVKFINPEGTKYGVVLHQLHNLKGHCEIIFSSGNAVEIIAINKLKRAVSSLNVIKLNSSISGGSVTLCEHTDCVKTRTDDTEEAWKIFTFGEGSPVNGLDSSVVAGFPNLKIYKYDNGDAIGDIMRGVDLSILRTWDKGVSALKVQNYLAVLFREPSYDNTCEVFNISDSNLSDGNPIDDERAFSMMIIKGTK